MFTFASEITPQKAKSALTAQEVSDSFIVQVKASVKFINYVQFIHQIFQL